MKKIILIFVSLFQLLVCYSECSNMNDFINNLDVSFYLHDINKDNRFFAGIAVNKGEFECWYGGHIEACILGEYKILENSVVVYFEKTLFINFSEGDNLLYRRWIFPRRYKVELTREDFINASKMEENNLDISFDSSKTYPTTCQAIIIDNLNIREKPSLSGKKIGLLKKRSEVTLYEESENWDEIDGEKSPWYKVKLDAENYGWVYGGYVRIFFEDDSLGYSDKEFILKSIE